VSDIESKLRYLFKNKTNKVELLILQALHDLEGRADFENIFNLIGDDSLEIDTIRKVLPDAILSPQGLRTQSNQLETKKDPHWIKIDRHHGNDRSRDVFKITPEGEKHVDSNGIF